MDVPVELAECPDMGLKARFLPPSRTDDLEGKSRVKKWKSRAGKDSDKRDSNRGAIAVPSAPAFAPAVRVGFAPAFRLGLAPWPMLIPISPRIQTCFAPAFRLGFPPRREAKIGFLREN
jgi:hypothetical protein